MILDYIITVLLTICWTFAVSGYETMAMRPRTKEDRKDYRKRARVMGVNEVVCIASRRRLIIRAYGSSNVRHPQNASNPSAP